MTWKMFRALNSNVVHINKDCHLFPESNVAELEVGKDDDFKPCYHCIVTTDIEYMGSLGSPTPPKAAAARDLEHILGVDNVKFDPDERLWTTDVQEITIEQAMQIYREGYSLRIPDSAKIIITDER